MYHVKVQIKYILLWRTYNLNTYLLLLQSMHQTSSMLFIFMTLHTFSYCSVTHGSAAVYMNTSMPTVAYCMIHAGNHTMNQWSNCCDSLTSSSKSAVLVCSSVYTLAHTHACTSCHIL